MRLAAYRHTSRQMYVVSLGAVYVWLSVMNNEGGSVAVRKAKHPPSPARRQHGSAAWSQKDRQGFPLMCRPRLYPRHSSVT